MGGQVKDIGLTGQFDRIMNFDAKDTKILYKGEFYEYKSFKDSKSKKSKPYIFVNDNYYELIESTSGYTLGDKYEND